MNTIERSAEFIAAAIAIADAVDAGASPDDPAVLELLNNLVTDFDVTPLVGTDFSNVFTVNPGDLTYTNGLGGNDVLLGLRGTDVLVGGDGSDVLRGYGGDDALFGGADRDIMSGGFGDDYLRGGSGNDVLNGEHGDDFLRGGSGRDKLIGGNGEDTLWGGDDNDTINGGRGDDAIGGGAGSDRIVGGIGNDYIEGNDGFDRLNGNDGNDILIGGSGPDILAGGEGHDQFHFDPSNATEGNDVIRDFLIGEDTIVLELADILAATAGIADADGNDGFTAADLDASADWRLISSPDGDLKIDHPGGTITLDGIGFAASLTFEALVDLGAVDVI